MPRAVRLPAFTGLAFFCSIHLALGQTPGPPSALAVTVNVNNTITLQWTAPATGGAATSYVVQIGTAPGGNQVVNEQIGNITTYTPSFQLNQGTTYYVRVRAINSSGVSASSEEVRVTIQCTAPTESVNALTWRMLSATAAQIAWVPPPVVAFSDYKVEVGTTSGASNTAVVFTGSGRRTFITLDLPVPGSYFARVRGVSSCNGIEGPASSDVRIQTGVGSAPSTTIVVNEFNGFVELKNISTASQLIEGWRVQTTTGSDQIGVFAASIRAGVVLPPGCTYLLTHPSDTIGIPGDEPIAAFVNEGVAIVRPDGLIVDSAGRRNSFDIAQVDTPFVEGNPLRARRDTSNVASFARVADTDTNDNSADFVELATATPQNASGCGQTPPGSGVPGPPTNLTVLVSGNSVTLSWTAPTSGGAPTQYLLEAGTAPGATNAGALLVPVSPTAIGFVGVPNGTYFARVRALNGTGASAASNEVVIVVCGVGCTGPPGPVTNLDFLVSGSNVLLTWTPPASGAAPAGYVVEVGTASGFTDLGQFATDSTAPFVIGTNVPAGAYFVRVRADVDGVLGAPSNEVLIIVP